MKLLHLFKSNGKNSGSLNEIVIKIKNGDKGLREQLIYDYRPFIIKTVSRTVGRYIEIENSEEYSVGLLAFNEAIDSFDPEKNKSFLAFSEQVIKRRIIDHQRSDRKNKGVYNFTYFESDDDNNDFEEKYLKSDASHEYEQIEIKEQIVYYTEKLACYGITLSDLVACSPKHKDSMRMATRLGRVLAENDELYNKLVKTRGVPIVELLKEVDVSRKTVEKYRKFIIAVCLVLRSNLDTLKSHIKDLEKGGKDLV